MKKLIIAATVIMASLAVEKADAYVFTANAQCTYNAVQASCAVANQLPRPIQCWGRVNAQTAYGAVLWANANLVVAPGTYQYVYVHSNYADPIVGAWAEIHCRSL